VKLGVDGAPAGNATALASAGEAADAAEGADPAVAECPLHNTTVTLNVVLWRIRQFGGGFHMPTVRADYCIDAYAALLCAVKADVCVVAGLERTPGLTVTASDTGFAYAPEVVDSGPAEATRLLAALAKKDAAAGWAMVIPKGDDGKILYEGGATSAIFYKTSEGRARTAIDTVDGSADDRLGLGQRLVHCAFSIPSQDGGPSVTFDVLAPLGRPVVPVGTAPALPAPTGEMPASFLLALSALDDVVGNASRLSAVRSSIGAQLRPDTAEGTVLLRPFWRTVWDRSDTLLEDFIVVNPADVHLHDEAMHWEAMKPPDHPDTVGDVAGELYDAIFVRNESGTPRFRVRGVRVADLVRAALSPDEIGALSKKPAAAPTAAATAGAPAPDAAATAPAAAAAAAPAAPAPKDEDGALVEQRAAHRAAAGYLDHWSVEDDSANRLAECAEFTAVLSDHWPLVATIDVHS
jgi:hypothetical protein